MSGRFEKEGSKVKPTVQMRSETMALVEATAASPSLVESVMGRGGKARPCWFGHRLLGRLMQSWLADLSVSSVQHSCGSLSGWSTVSAS